jgi:hypothetical protein
MTGNRLQDLPPPQRRRVIAWAVLRTVLIAAALWLCTTFFRWTGRGTPIPRCGC